MNSEIVAATALTVAARLTPAFPSAIATIAVHGPLAVEIVGRLVKCKPPFRSLNFTLQACCARLLFTS